MSKFIAAFAILFGTYALSYFSMTIAWGLEIKSWPAYLMLCLGQILLFGAMQAIKDEA